MKSRTLASIFLLTLFVTLACGAPAVLSERANVTPTDTSVPTYQATAENATYTVLVPLTVRSAPCESSNEIAYLSTSTIVETAGEPVICEQDGGSWVLLRDPSGWVNRKYLSIYP